VSLLLITSYPLTFATIDVKTKIFHLQRTARLLSQIAQLIIHKSNSIYYTTTTEMMVEDNISSADVENQSQPAATTDTTSTTYTNKKPKVIALIVFLLVAVVLAITLPLTIGRNNNNSTDSSNGSTTNSDGGTSSEGDDSSNQDASTDNNLGASPLVQVYKSQYLDSNGPIQAQVRIMDPSVTGKSALVYIHLTFIYLICCLCKPCTNREVNVSSLSSADGYEQCSDLRKDIENAVNHYANNLIMREATSEWQEEYYGNFTRCDPNSQPNWGWGDDVDGEATATVGTSFGGVAEMDSVASVESVAAPSRPMADDSAGKVSEDSYETNNQVDGVDEADVVKSDGEYVYAAYGDLIYVWNATDGTQGVSITQMPYVKNNNENCKPIIRPVEPEVIEIEESSPTERRRKDLSMIAPWDPCYQPKPRISSLLLHEDRLTAIVSDETSLYYSPFDSEEDGAEEKKDPIINDWQKLTIRVYDVSDVALDGSGLPLLAEKEIKGNYNSARSINSKGIVMATSNVNMYNFADGNLYRSRPQYCGLNSTEYQRIAAEEALNHTQSFVDQLLEELQLQLDGTCSSIFKVAAMQSGNSTKDASYDGNMLSSFVQILSFDMMDVEDEITTDVAGGFSSGYVDSVYASQDFGSIQSIGHNYNPETKEWESSTFILGFDISGDAPKPLGYGEVQGRPINQYATDLYDGHLRIATTESQWSMEGGSKTTNKIFVLKVPSSEDDGSVLSVVGETDPFGKKGESIHSVRFIGPQAYVVTFLRTQSVLRFRHGRSHKPSCIGRA